MVDMGGSLRVAWKRACAIPLPFLGTAFYRAWVSVLFAESPTSTIAGYLPGGLGRVDYLDVGCLLVMVMCAVLFRRIGALCERRRLCVSTAAIMSGLSAVVALRYAVGWRTPPSRRAAARASGS